MKHPIEVMAKSRPSRIIFWDPGVDPTARFICQASAAWWRSGKNPLGADNSVWKIGDPIFTNRNRKPDPIHWIIMIISFAIKMALAGVYSPFSDTPNSLGISWQCSHARGSIHKKDMWEHVRTVLSLPRDVWLHIEAMEAWQGYTSEVTYGF